MHPAIIALLGFVSWTLVLGLWLVSIRSFKVLMGTNKSDEFPAGIKHGSEFYWRLNRAHLNCIENLPLFGVLVLVGAFTGVLDGTFGLVSQIVQVREFFRLSLISVQAQCLQSIPGSPVLSYNTEVLHTFFGTFFTTLESLDRLKLPHE